jgi:hypothetical protein
MYCGAEFSAAVKRTTEHVVARKFVPIRFDDLSGQWKLEGYACGTCNGVKADLEDDIGAITMQPDGFGEYADDSAELRREAARKARGAMSRITRRAVAASGVKVTCDASLLQDSPCQSGLLRLHRLGMKGQSRWRASI